MAGIMLGQLLPAIRRSQYFNESSEFMELLGGTVDGMRRTFRTQNAPIVYDPDGRWGAPCAVAVYDAAENVIDPRLYVLASTKNGAVQFTSAPALAGPLRAPFYATYHWADLDLIDLWGAIRQGFDEMESRFYRGFQLAPVPGTVTPVPNQSDLAIIDPATGDDPGGPNGTTFATSVVQLDFLGLCTAYRLARDYFWSAGKSAYGYREGRMGMEVDPKAALQAQQKHLDEISKRMIDALDQARAEWDSANSGLGTSVFNPASRGYVSMFAWQGSSVLPTSGYGGFVGG